MSRMYEWLDQQDDEWDRAFPVEPQQPKPLEQLELWPGLFPRVPK